MDKKYEIINKEGLVVCSNMIMQVAVNVYSFLNDVYKKDFLILQPIEEVKENSKEIEKVEAEEVKDSEE